MATSLIHDAKSENWAEPRSTAGTEPMLTRAEWLWTFFGLALLGAFLALLVDDFPLRTLIAVN